MNDSPAARSDARPTPAELRWPWKNLYFPRREVIGDPEPQFLRASTIVRLFYAFLVYQAVMSYGMWLLLMEREEAQPLWPIFWIRAVPWEPAVFAIGLLFILGAAAAAMFPANVLARFFAFLGMFLFESVRYSFGKISHSHHIIVGTALVLIFLPAVLPRAPDRARTQRRYLEVFWGAQAYILLTYSMAGISKLHGAVLDMMWDRRSLLSAESLASHIAHDYVSRGKSSPLGMGEFIIANPWFGGPLYWAAVALEFFSFAVAWKPGIHRVWGLALIGLHVGIGLAMEVWFRPGLIVLGMFFIGSPFLVDTKAFHFRLRDIPWLGPFLDALRQEMRSQRQTREGTLEESERIDVFLHPGWRLAQRMEELLSRPDADDLFRIHAMEGEAWRERVEMFPYLGTVDTIVVDAETGEAREFRTGAEACLWALAHLRRSGWRNAFVLLLIPNPFLELGLRWISRRGAARTG